MISLEASSQNIDHALDYPEQFTPQDNIHTQDKPKEQEDQSRGTEFEDGKIPAQQEVATIPEANEVTQSKKDLESTAKSDQNILSVHNPESANSSSENLTTELLHQSNLDFSIKPEQREYTKGSYKPNLFKPIPIDTTTESEFIEEAEPRQVDIENEKSSEKSKLEVLKDKLKSLEESKIENFEGLEMKSALKIEIMKLQDSTGKSTTGGGVTENESKGDIFKPNFETTENEVSGKNAAFRNDTGYLSEILDKMAESASYAEQPGDLEDELETEYI